MLRSVSRAVLVVLVVGLITLACSAGGGLLPAGTSCSSDGDCGIGLSCLLIRVQADGGSTCSSLVAACSKACQTENDCEAVGTAFHCFLCDGTGVCAQTQ
jgi:hypothetical protein